MKKTKNFRKSTLEAHMLINKFVPEIRPSEWPREMKLAKQLLEEFGAKFLMTVHLGFKLNSLAFLIGGEGLEKLKRLKKDYDYKPEIKTNTFEEMGEKHNIEYKKKATLREFLR